MDHHVSLVFSRRTPSGSCVCEPVAKTRATKRSITSKKKRQRRGRAHPLLPTLPARTQWHSVRMCPRVHACTPMCDRVSNTCTHMHCVHVCVHACGRIGGGDVMVSWSAVSLLSSSLEYSTFIALIDVSSHDCQPQSDIAPQACHAAIPGCLTRHAAGRPGGWVHGRADAQKG